jgi:hypothetical protein
MTNSPPEVELDRVYQRILAILGGRVKADDYNARTASLL